MIYKKNKKAGSRILSFYWIIIFVLITIAITSGTLIFYSQASDVRPAETRILSDRVLECISEYFQIKFYN